MQRILVPSPSFVKVAISSLVIWLCIPVSLIFGQIVPVSRAAGADIYVFHSSQGGQITGEWLNPKESPRQTYQVRTAEGVVVTLDRAQVSDKPARQKPVEIEYEKLSTSVSQYGGRPVGDCRVVPGTVLGGETQGAPGADPRTRSESREGPARPGVQPNQRALDDPRADE